MRDADPGKRRQRKRKIWSLPNRWWSTAAVKTAGIWRRCSRMTRSVTGALPATAKCARKKGFETLEVPYALQQLELTKPMQSGCALLECMSNLVANELFCPQGSGEQTEEAVLRGVERLVSGCAQVVIVTNELFSDGMQYDPSTEHYLRILGRINCRLAQMADRVYEVVAGIAIPWKWGKNRNEDQDPFWSRWMSLFPCTLPFPCRRSSGTSET